MQQSPLMHAIRNGNLEKLKSLIQEGQDIHWENDSAFRYACSLGNLEMVKYLAEKGAFIHSEDDDGFTWAAQSGNLELVKYLLSIGDFPTSTIEKSIKYIEQNKNKKGIKEIIEHLKNLITPKVQPPPTQNIKKKKEEEEEEEFEDDDTFTINQQHGPQLPPKSNINQNLKLRMPPTLTSFDIYEAFLSTLNANNINAKYTSGTYGGHNRAELIFIMEKETEHLIRDAAEKFTDEIEKKFKVEIELKFRNDYTRGELYILFEYRQRQNKKQVKSKYYRMKSGKLILNSNEICKALFNHCKFKMTHFITSNATLKATFNYEGNYPKEIWNGKNGVRKFIYDNIPYILHLEVDDDTDEDSDGTLVIWFQLINSLETID